MRVIDFLQKTADELGPAIGALTQRLLAHPLPWTRMRGVRALIALARRHGAERVDAVCVTGLAHDMLSIPRLRRMLESAATVPKPEPPRPLPPGRFLRPIQSFALPTTTTTNGEPSCSDYEPTLRQSVLAAKKDVALIAPWLGYRDLKRGSIGLGALGEGKGCQLYLEQVLTALGDLWGIKNLRIGTLIIAGHSAGGLMMRDAVKTLGGLQPNLKECWGFDCIYGPASTWRRVDSRQ